MNKERKLPDNIENYQFVSMFRDSDLTKPVLYKGKKIFLSHDIALPSENQRVRVIIERSDSDVTQAVVIATWGKAIFPHGEFKGTIMLREDKGHVHEFVVNSPRKSIRVTYNWFDINKHNGRENLMGLMSSQACHIEVLRNAKSWRYHWNDYMPDDDFDDFVFRVELVDD